MQVSGGKVVPIDKPDAAKLKEVKELYKDLEAAADKLEGYAPNHAEQFRYHAKVLLQHLTGRSSRQEASYFDDDVQKATQALEDFNRVGTADNPSTGDIVRRNMQGKATEKDKGPRPHSPAWREQQLLEREARERGDLE